MTEPSPSAEFLDDAPVRNPWLTSHSSGASSAGAAVLVAAGAVRLAHANDEVEAALEQLRGTEVLRAAWGLLAPGRRGAALPVP